MKANQLLFLLVFAYSSNITAQTKVIAHKSHGGTMANFNLAMESDIFDLSDSNFGEPANPMIRYTLDTIHILTDTSALITKRKHCYDYRLDSTYDEVEKDTIFSPIFSPIESDQAIKSNLRKVYPIPAQAVDSTVIIGPDSSPKVHKQEKRNITPTIIDLPSNPPSNLKWIGLINIFIMSLLIGLWNKIRKK